VMPAAVVLDCDGVLVDSEPHSIAAWLEVLGRLGHPASRSDVAACTGLGFAPTFAALGSVAPLPSQASVWAALVDALDRSFSGGLEVFADAIAVVDECLARGIPVAVASASARQRLDLTLARAALAGRFAVSVAGDEVLRGKPAPDVYLAAAAALGVDAAKCVAVEDTAAGVRAAVDAGMRVVAVVRADADPRLLEAAGARVVEHLVPEAVLTFGAGQLGAGSR